MHRIWLDGERTRDTDTLFHAARQLARIGILEPGEADEVHDLRDRCLSLGGALAACAERLADIVGDREPGIEREALEHDRDPGVEPGERRAAISYGTLIGLDQPGEHTHQRRLAAPGGAEQREDLLLANLQRDVLEHLDRGAARQLVDLREVLQIAQGVIGHHGS
jgi:hypothetical protein